MCDYSLHHVKSRPAKVDDKLRTVNFNTGTRGFASPDDRTTAVCVLPGTELAFSEEVKCAPAAFGFTSWRTKTVNYRTAIFRQVNKDIQRVHHDALEFADGTSVLLTDGASAFGTAKNASRESGPEARHVRGLTLARLSGIKTTSRRHGRRLCFLRSLASSLRYAASVASSMGSIIDGSSFSGLLTRVEIGHIRIRSAGNGSIKSRGSGSSPSQGA